MQRNLGIIVCDGKIQVEEGVAEETWKGYEVCQFATFIIFSFCKLLRLPVSSNVGRC